MNNRQVYIITLKNGKKLRFWFMGTELEKVLKDYNIPYEKKDKFIWKK